MADGNSVSIAIGVATHKPYKMPTDSIYFPVHAGAGLHPDVLNDIQGDDTGENISAQNAFLSELTVLYWMWKNCDADYKAISHYRRHFATPKPSASKDPFDRIATREDIERAITLSPTGIVLPKMRNYLIETVGDHHRHVAYGVQLDTLRDVVAEQQPRYLDEFDRHFNGTKTHLYNMFVMPQPYFDDYCAWLFPLLFEIEKRHDPRQYTPYDARYPGRLSEYILDVWLNVNGLAYSELPVVDMEPVSLVKKGTTFLAAKFLGRKYTKSF